MMMSNYFTRTVFILVLTLAYIICQAKNLTNGLEFQYIPIITTVPFMIITKDFRHGAMGDVGVSTSPDDKSQNWKPSNYFFPIYKFGLANPYTSGRKQLVTDINLAYLAGHFKADKNKQIDLSLNYLSKGYVCVYYEYGLSTRINIFNIGSTISYDEVRSKGFLPANRGQGTTYPVDINPHNSFTCSLDFNYLMISTPKANLNFGSVYNINFYF